MPMNARTLLDLLLQSGRGVADKGQDVAEKKLDVPKEGPEREAALSGMRKGATLAGVLTLLVGTRAGRRLTGTALKLGSVAAIGKLAYNAYHDWQAKQSGTPSEPGKSVDELTGSEADQRSLTLLKAMIGAAKADGHIDEVERGKIEEYIQKLELDPSTRQFVQDEIAKPLSAKEIAASANSAAAAAEIYLTSLLAIDADNDQERAYLSELVHELKLAPDLVAQLEAKARA
jgi:uncharacterized membrane protein YebE (DUF533 family)